MTALRDIDPIANGLGPSKRAQLSFANNSADRGHLSASKPQPLNLTLFPGLDGSQLPVGTEFECGNVVYDYPIAKSCEDAILQMPQGNQVVEWSDRRNPNQGGMIHVDFETLPWRFVSSDGSCAIEIGTNVPMGQDNASYSSVIGAAWQLYVTCARKRKDGVVKNLGLQGKLNVTMEQYKPNVGCGDPESVPASVAACSELVRTMIATKDPVTFHRGFNLPYTKQWGDCRMTLDIAGPRAVMRWYDLYAAAVAINSMCVRNHQDGFAVLYGNRYSTLLTLRFDNSWNLGPGPPAENNGTAAQVITNSGHDDMIHDAVLDYYGRRLATCSSDRTIKIFEVEGESHKLTETLRGRSLAHPKYGNILASSSYDGTVKIWRETPPTSTHTNSAASSWQNVASFALHTASVNIVSWSPHESGCLLACASSDGQVSVLEFQEGNWTHQIFHAHGAGVNAVSWAPATVPGSLVSSKPSPGGVRRFVTGGSDNTVKIWDYNPQSHTYTPTISLPGHTDWVRDVAWAPTLLSKSYIASASQDKTVRIWTSALSEPNEWKATVLQFDAVLWRVSWSLSGNVLAVSGGDNKVSLWKENLGGEWDCVKWIEE
ncbi:GTPase-activating protein S13 [Lecanora helva]